jgi:hypothetical protein
VAQQLLCIIDSYPGKKTMPHRKRRAKAAGGHHRLSLPAVLYLSGVVLILNAWLVSQQVLGF